MAEVRWSEIWIMGGTGHQHVSFTRCLVLRRCFGQRLPPVNLWPNVAHISFRENSVTGQRSIEVRGRLAPGTASSSGTSRPSLPTLLAGIFVSGIVSCEGHESTCLHEWSLHQLCLVYLDLCRHWRQIKTHQNPLCCHLFSTAGDSVLQTNCIELHHEFYLVQLSNSKENCPCCTGRMHTRWATFLKLLLSGLSL